MRCQYLDSLNWTLWLRFHVRYWYQSFIDGSNIWVVDRTDPWGPEMDHPPLDCTYLVVVPPYDMSCALFLLTVFYGLDFVADIDINPSSMGPIFGVLIGPTWGPEMYHPPLGCSYLVAVLSYDMSRTLSFWTRLYWWDARYWYQSFINGSNILGVYRIYPWATQMEHPTLDRSYLVVVPSYDVSCACVLLTGLYGLDFVFGIDINPSSMGPIFGVLIGSNLGFPKWTIRHWTVAICSSAVVWWVICLYCQITKHPTRVQVVETTINLCFCILHFLFTRHSVHWSKLPVKLRSGHRQWLSTNYRG